MTGNPDRPLHVILVDDNEDHLELLAMALGESSGTGERYKVSRYTDPLDAVANLPASGPVAVCCDYNMPGGTGLDWLPDFLRADLGPVIMLTSEGDGQIAASAFKSGAADYVVKSRVIDHPDIFRATIQDAVRRDALQRRNRQLAKELKMANAQLASKNELLAELTDTAHRFVDNVAHEFRTPLTVIKEFASIMADGIGGPVTDEQAEYLGFIVGSVRDLAQLVDDFLDSSKLKARTLRLDRDRHTVTELFDSVRPLLLCRAASRQITINEHVVDGLPSVWCDIEKARRVIINLAVNAIKLSDTGTEITLSAFRTDDGDVRIGVSDQGPGLSAEDTAMVFERFRQIGDVEKSTTKGFGLGLSIAKELVRLNLGTLDVESEQGVGSTFSFTLPADDPEVVLDRYVRRITESQVGAHLSALRVVPSGETGLAALRGTLASICHPTDLVLEAGDDESVVAIGITSEIDGWMSRLQGFGGSFTIEPIGCWPVAEAKTVMRAELSNRLVSSARCA